MTILFRLTTSEPIPPGSYEWVLAAPGPGPDPIPPIPPNPNPIPPNSVLLTWGQGLAWYSAQSGGFQCEQTLIFAFDVPADAPAGAYMQFNLAEYQSLPTTRQLALSKVAGAFDPADTITPSQGTSVGCNCIPGVNVQPGGRYFINVRNWSTDLDGYSCVPATNVNCIMNWVAARR